MPVKLSELEELKLTPEMINRRRELTEKLKAGTITLEEIDELIHILNVEEEVAKEQGEFGAVVGIVALRIIAEVRRNELVTQSINR